MEAWANIRSVEMRETEKIQGKTLKMIFQLPFSTTYLYWYHNRNRNVVSSAKNPICYNDALS